MGIVERIKTAVEWKGYTIRELSNQADIPYRTLQNYLYGVRPPSIEAVAKICTCLGVSANWLLLDRGPRELDADELSTKRVEPASQLSRLRLALGDELERKLGLGQLALSRQRSIHPLAWDILVYLNGRSGKGTTLEELAEQCGNKELSQSDLLACLSILEKEGNIRESSPGLFAAAQISRPRKYTSSPELEAAVLGAIEHLSEVVLTSLDGGAKLVRVQAKVPKGEAAELLSELLNLQREKLAEAEVQGDEFDVIELLFSATISS